MGGLVWLIVLAAILLRTDFDPITKLTWVIVVIFVPVFGLLFYWFLAPSRPEKEKIDLSNQLSGTPWENNPGHTNK
jgi:heme/copper-type cytochrome/quinol oxidase subunit 2